MSNVSNARFRVSSEQPVSYLTVGFKEEKPVPPIYLEIEKNLLASSKTWEKMGDPAMARFCIGYAAYWKKRGEDARTAKVGFSRKQQKRMKREAARKARYEDMD